MHSLTFYPKKRKYDVSREWAQPSTPPACRNYPGIFKKKPQAWPRPRHSDLTTQALVFLKLSSWCWCAASVESHHSTYAGFSFLQDFLINFRRLAQPRFCRQVFQLAVPNLIPVRVFSLWKTRPFLLFQEVTSAAGEVLVLGSEQGSRSFLLSTVPSESAFHPQNTITVLFFSLCGMTNPQVLL